MNAYNTHAPIKILSNKAGKNYQKPWLTTAILNSIKEKRRLLKEYSNSKDTYLLAHFKEYRRILKKTIKTSKIIYFVNIFSQNISNIKKTWRNINKLLHKGRGNQNQTQLSINDTVTSDKTK